MSLGSNIVIKSQLDSNMDADLINTTVMIQ